MGRLVTGADNPTVLYVSGGNTQVCSLSSCKLINVFFNYLVFMQCFGFLFNVNHISSNLFIL